VPTQSTEEAFKRDVEQDQNSVEDFLDGGENALMSKI